MSSTMITRYHLQLIILLPNFAKKLKTYLMFILMGVCIDKHYYPNFILSVLLIDHLLFET